jgi:hypothetical protein
MEQSFSEQGLQIYFVRQSETPSEYFLEAFKVSALASQATRSPKISLKGFH